MSTEETIAQNLKVYKKRNGFTEKDLAKRSGLSVYTIKAISSGKKRHKSDTLRSVAKALNISMIDLFTPMKSLSTPHFRAWKKFKSKEHIFIEDEVKTWIENYNTVLDLVGYKQNSRLLKITKRKPLEVAKEVRNLLEIKPQEPIYDILGLINEFDIKVKLKEFKNPSFFGFSVGEVDGGPCIIINSDKNISVERKIFTAAHELGHIILHKKAASSKEEEDNMEEEANEFASNLLMPNETFSQQWENSCGSPLYDRIIRLKILFKVSYAVVLYRISKIYKYDFGKLRNFIKEEHCKRTGKKITIKEELPPALMDSDFFLKKEEIYPIQDTLFDEKLPRYTMECLKKGNITISKAAEILNVSVSKIKDLMKEAF